MTEAKKISQGRDRSGEKKRIGLTSIKSCSSLWQRPGTWTPFLFFCEEKLANIRNVENMSLPFSPKILQPASNDFTTLMKLDQQDGISQVPPMGQSGDRVA